MMNDLGVTLLWGLVRATILLAPPGDVGGGYIVLRFR